MNRKIWLIVFLLGSLILLMGGMYRPDSVDANPADPVVQSAKATVSQVGGGKSEEWEKAASENPLWILQIEAAEER